MRILLLGGSGLLARYLTPALLKLPIFGIDTPTRKELDITNWSCMDNVNDSYDLIIHAAAYTDVVKAEKEKRKCFDANVGGTENLVMYFQHAPFVYISSEYCFNPTNYYAQTKLGGETAVKAYCDKYLIIRSVFKPTPWPYDNAFIDQMTCGDEVDIIAPMIVRTIMEWDKEFSRTVHVGTGRKRVYDIAVKSKPDVRKSSVDEVKQVKLPKDYLI